MTVVVRFYVAAVAVVAGVCLALAGWSVPTAALGLHWNALAAFVVLGFLSEAFYLRLRVGQGETSSSVAFIPFIAAVLLFDTGWAILVAALSELAVEFAVRKKPAIKIVFNVSQLAICVALASWVFQALGGQPSAAVFVLRPVAIAGAVLTYFLVNSSAVSVAVALGDQVAFGKAWSRIGGASLVYDFASSALAALLAFLYVKWQLPGLLLVIVPIWFVRHNYHVVFQLEQVNRDLLELMVKAIEARDPYTSGHSLRVAQIAEQIATERGLASRIVSQVGTAALLHDVGKIHEDFAPLLRKSGMLDQTEKALMQTHPSRSADLVNTISGFRGPIVDAVRHHHEKYDGSGYPVGLAAEAIPLGSRIIMIADTIDAMTTNRPYRNALTFERVIAELQQFAGRQFDPNLVSLVVRSATIRTMVTARIASQSDRPARTLEVLTSAGRATARA
jgi:HD-GYP domain-containing protein (c-di-GMP phosphodiesterase class II)